MKYPSGRCLWRDGRGQCRRKAEVDSWPVRCGKHKNLIRIVVPLGSTDKHPYPAVTDG